MRLRIEWPTTITFVLALMFSAVLIVACEGGAAQTERQGLDLLTAMPDQSAATAFDATNATAPESAPPAFSQTRIGVGSIDTSLGDPGHTCLVMPEAAIVCWGSNTWGQATPPKGEFVAVSVGGGHSCAVKIRGSVVCWGRDDRGQATVPDGEYTSVATGDAHSCGVKTDGSVVCWGYNLDDDGNALGQSTPPGGEFVNVSAGPNYTCGVKADGSIECWGRAPRQPAEGKFTSVSAGREKACGVRTDGSVVCWGFGLGAGKFGQLMPPEGEFVDVSIGTDHACGLRADGAVACWGRDTDPYGNHSTRTSPPNGKFIAVSVGSTKSCGVRPNGAVSCWGDNSGMPLGLFTHISAGFVHTCGVRTNGSVECWGSSANGQANPPQTLIGFVSVSSGFRHSCGVGTDDLVQCWGGVWMGDGERIEESSPPSDEFMAVSVGNGYTCGVRTDGTFTCWGRTPKGTSVPHDRKLNSISAGKGSVSHICGVSSDGPVVCWGANQHGQSTPPDGTFTSVSAGESHTCGVKEDRSVMCWGLDDHGQSTPPDGTFTSVSAGGSHTCGVKEDRSVMCWGLDDHGRVTPPDGEFESVSAGLSHTCGLKTDGSIVCWGGHAAGLSSDDLPESSDGQTSGALTPPRPKGTPTPFTRATPIPTSTSTPFTGPTPRPTSTPFTGATPAPTATPITRLTPEPSICAGIGGRHDWTESECAVALGIIRDRNALSAIHTSTEVSTNWEAIVAKFNEGKSPDDAGYCYFPASYSLPLDKWCGVTTNSDGRVRWLSLGGIGAVDGQGWGIGLNGTIPSALGGMDALEVLTLSSGKVCGFFGCSGGLTGYVPRELGLLPELASVNLSGNELEGSVYSLSCLPKLTRLNLSNNRFRYGATKFLGNPCNVENAGLTTEIRLGRNPWDGEPRKVKEAISDDDEVITIQRGFLDLTKSTAGQLGVPTDVSSWAEDFLKGQSAELIAYGRHVNFRNRGATFVVSFAGELAKAYPKVVPVVGWVSFGADTAFTLYDMTRATVSLLEGVREAREVQSKKFLGVYALCELEYGWTTRSRPPRADEILRDTCE